jgi:hypothetical protein
MFQAGILRDATFGCDWEGTPILFQRCLMFIIATANKEFQLTARKFVPESKVTMLNVQSAVKMAVTNNTENVILYSKEAKLPRGVCKP